jgi:CBS-domain-containing membrane protein
MRCEEIMKREVKCLGTSDTVQVAATLMRDGGLGFLPVCDSSHRVLGTVTDRDLAIRVLAEARPATTRVAEIYTREVIACRPDDDLHTAQKLMAEHHKSRILCLDADGRLMGVISLSDIAQHNPGRASNTLREVSHREVRG